MNRELHTTQSQRQEQAATHQGQLPLPRTQIGVGCTKNNLCYNLGVKEQLLANFLSTEPK